jgi:hypothetical protein
MTSKDDSVFSNKRIKARKSFELDEQDGAFVITYEILNTSKKETFSLAPWEVMRLPAGGLSFFPWEETHRKTDGICVEVKEGVAWFDHKTSVEPEGQKIWMDGAEGWVAHVAGDLLHVKRYTPVPKSAVAPDEGEVELYSSGVASKTNSSNFSCGMLSK